MAGLDETMELNFSGENAQGDGQRRVGLATENGRYSLASVVMICLRSVKGIIRKYLRLAKTR